MTSLEQNPKFEKPRTHWWKRKCLALALATTLNGIPLKINSQNQNFEKVSPETEMLDKKATDLSDTENNANILKNEGLEIITLSWNVTAILVKQFLAMQEYVFQNATPLLENNAVISGQELMTYIEADEEVRECNFFCANDNETRFNIEWISVDLDTSDGNFKVEGNTIIINGSAIIDVRKSNGDRMAVCFNRGYNDFRIIAQNGSPIVTPSDRTFYLGEEYAEEIGLFPWGKRFNDNDKVTLPELESWETLPNSVVGFDEQWQHPEIGHTLFFQGEGSLLPKEVLKRLDHFPSSTQIVDLENGVKIKVDRYIFKFFSSDGGMSAGASVSPDKRKIAVVKGGLAPVDVNIENEGVGGTFEIFPFIWELGAFSEEPLSGFSQVPIGIKLQLKIQPKSEEGYKIKRVIINGEEQNLDDPNATTVIEIELKKFGGNSVTVEFGKNQEAPQWSINLMPEENGHTEFYKELENGERSPELSGTELDNLEVWTKIKIKSFDDPGYCTKEVLVNNSPYWVDENNELEFEVEEWTTNIKVVRELDTSSVEVAESKVKIWTSNGEIIIMTRGTQISNLDIYNVEGKRIYYTRDGTDDLRVSVEEGVYIVSFDENNKRKTTKVLVKE